MSLSTAFWLAVAGAVTVVVATSFDDQAKKIRKVVTNIGAVVAMFAAFLSSSEQAAFQQESLTKAAELQKIGQNNAQLSNDNVALTKQTVALTTQNVELSKQLVNQSNLIEKLNARTLAVATGGTSRAAFRFEFLYTTTDNKYVGVMGGHAREALKDAVVAKCSVRFRLEHIGRDPLRGLGAWLSQEKNFDPKVANRQGNIIYQQMFETFSKIGLVHDPKTISEYHQLTRDRALFEGHFSALNGFWRQII